MENTTEMRIGKTLFIVTGECSETATETAVQKIKKLISQHAFDSVRVIRKLSHNGENPLDMCETVREYGADTIKKE